MEKQLLEKLIKDKTYFYQECCHQLIFDLEAIFYIFYVSKFSQIEPIYQRHSTSELIRDVKGNSGYQFWKYQAYFPLLRSLIILISLSKQEIFPLITQLGYRHVEQDAKQDEQSQQPHLSGKKSKQLLASYNLEYLNLDQIAQITKKLII